MTTTIETLCGKKFFIVNTGIAQSSYRQGITSLKVKDDKKNDVFMMSVKLDADTGSVEELGCDALGVTVNGVADDGNFVIMMPICDDVEIEDLKKAFGSKLVKASGYLDTLKAQMIAEAAAVDGIFAGIDTVANAG